jgi:hypothetical protein
MNITARTPGSPGKPQKSWNAFVEKTRLKMFFRSSLL